MRDWSSGGYVQAGDCPDHPWTDACPYVGVDCPPKAERDRITAKLSADYAARQP